METARITDRTRRARTIAIGLVVLTALLVACLGAWRLLRTAPRHVEVDRSVYPVCGVDLSAHNGVVSFDSLRQCGIDFVYLKATEGNTFRDMAFERNYAAARRTGIPVGAYHFFRFDCDAAGQAANFMAAVAGRQLDMPLVLDVEEWSNSAGQTTATVRERLAAMVQLLRANGYDVAVYTNKQGLAAYVEPALGSEDVPVWICSFTNPPLPRQPWLLWQHSHQATLPGVQGAVDLNTFNGSRAQWEQYLHGRRKAQ